MSKTRLLLATTNLGKLREIKSFLSDLPFQVCSLHRHRLKKAYEEKGKTFLENARGKSLFFSHTREGLILAEDSGLEIEYLKGAPGVFSARFSGPAATDEKNIQHVLELMDSVPLIKRKARFVCCAVLSTKGSIIHEIQETVEGLITLSPWGEGGFGYDPVFFYPPMSKTFAELSPEEKNEVSHRGKALRKLKEFLRQNYS